MPHNIFRFAPSPTGYLHLGHVYSALFSYHKALQYKGKFLIRIEDIDTERCRDIYETSILEDLEWLGLEWERPYRRQSTHLQTYAETTQKLQKLGVLYPCFCSRRTIREKIADLRASGRPVQEGPDGPLYPKTCHGLPQEDAQQRIDNGDAYSLRLDTQKALSLVADKDLSFKELTHTPTGHIPFAPEFVSDMILARKEIPTSYHLAVITDDALQGVTHVTRGEDLYQATFMHRLLQEILGYPAPTYAHHPLILGDDGIKLSKRKGSTALNELRQQGLSADQIRDLAQATTLWNEIREMRGY